jgi:poly(3-hydroxybutyrate) depolymerase
MGRLLYSAYHANGALFAPARAGSAAAAKLLRSAPSGVRGSRLARHLNAVDSIASGARLTHRRPEFGISSVLVDGVEAPVEQDVVDSTPFASLVRFRTAARPDAPKVLLVAPLSGHFATMLTPTVRTMLQDHEVFITDWYNARDVPVKHGEFGLDDYVDHIVRFLREIGAEAHVMAVCQPCVPALMATAVLAEADDPIQPRSLTLMSGPIDTRVNPTKINLLAYRQSMARYRKFLTRVPRPYGGAGRLVYPGFLQVGGFMSMNFKRHVSSHVDIYRNIARGQAEASERIQEFYAEYFAVLDLDAKFYLDTIERVFQKDLLARGEMTHHGRPVVPQDIHRTALLTVEAERDDMCAVGQTEAAHRLVTGIEADMHQHYVQEGVGHYGVFAGSRWSAEVYPVIRAFIQKHDGADGADDGNGSARRLARV